jgi:hypothetical protein
VDHEKLAQRLRTLHAINVTPFREDRVVDYDLLERNIEFLVANGLGVIVPCGNTGEFYALSVEEAQAVTRFVVERSTAERQYWQESATTWAPLGRWRWLRRKPARMR